MYSMEFLFNQCKQAQDEALERVQKVSLKVILGPVYVDYQSTLSVLELETLKVRRDKLYLSFAKKCLKTQRHSAPFPAVPVAHDHRLRNIELFTVNHARTERYSKSAIPLLNDNSTVVED